MDIPTSVSNVSDVSIGAIDASATLAVGSGGGSSVFAGVVVSAKGAPFELLSIHKNNYQNILGKPLHPSKGASYEPMRHISEAVTGGHGYVVRVVPSEARFPYLVITKGKGKGAEVKASDSASGKSAAITEKDKAAALVAAAQDTVTTGNAPYGTPLNLPTGADLVIYIADGDPSLTRSLSMSPADSTRYGAGMYHLVLTEVDELGFESELENLLVSMNPEALNDMNQPAYIVTALENGSRHMRAIVGANALGLTGFTKTAFAGGTNGDMNKISVEQYTKAISVLRNAMVRYTAVLGLGCYDTTIIPKLSDLCSDRRIDGFFDIPPTLNYAGARKWITDLNLDNHRMCAYHFPFCAKDPFSGSSQLWGLSGTAFVAKALGVAKVADVGGWHYSPAGEERGIINRREIRPMPGLDEPDYMEMYRLRINKVAFGVGGKMVIDDAITCRSREDYLRFQHVSSVMDAINREFYGIARALKHQPDGLTLDGLTGGMERLLNNFITSGALVKPRNSEDGDKPYVLTVTQKAIDLWEVHWSCCITGTARRIHGKPALIR